MQQPNPTNIKQIGLIVPLIGFYDAPDALPFEPLIRSKPSMRACVFAFYSQLLRGKTYILLKTMLVMVEPVTGFLTRKQGYLLL